MGTPAFAVPTLSKILVAGHDVACVYTQPPRKSGRGQKLQPSPVHAFAQSYGLKVRTPKNFKQDEDQEAFKALGLDVAVVVAYGLLLPQQILHAPTHGCLNLHGSNLPRWRGAAPIQRAIMAGDKETAVMVMQMDKGLDTGPVLLAEPLKITATDTSASLSDRMCELGAGLMVRALLALEQGELVPEQQADEGVTYAHKIAKDEARLDWSKSATELDCLIRGLNPAPGAWFEVETSSGPTRVKVLTATPDKASGSPGEIIAAPLRVACGQVALEISQVQRAGKGPCSAAEFIRGINLPIGARLK